MMFRHCQSDGFDARQFLTPRRDVSAGYDRVGGGLFDDVARSPRSRDEQSSKCAGQSAPQSFSQMAKSLAYIIIKMTHRRRACRRQHFMLLRQASRYGFEVRVAPSIV